MRPSRTLILLAVLVGSTGCLTPAGFVATSIGTQVGANAAIGASNRAVQGKLSFDSAQVEKTRITARSEQILTVRGIVIWSPPGKNAQFFPLDSVSAFEVQMFDSAGRAVITNQEPIKVWDGQELITAIPPNKPVRFEMRATIATNVWRVVRSAKVKGDHYTPIKTVK
ncbi:MAG TPA: hypothetical protein VGM77_12270 [Gemmatimonadales bacterium]|jgi:hypothetical protein